MDIGTALFLLFIVGVPVVAFFNMGIGPDDSKSDTAIWAVGAVVIGVLFVAGILFLG
jgi:predicted permease